jgi:hypothetical protein
MAEVDRATKGQPFRLDCPAGPVFVAMPLWRFAGRSGRELGAGPTLRDRPAWGGDWTDRMGDEKVAA